MKKSSLLAVLALCCASFTLGVFAPRLHTPNTGAYEATLVLQNGQSQLKGIAVIQEHQITADGESVKVDHWDDVDNMLTAYAEDGSIIFKLKRTAEGMLEQPHPNGRLVFRRYDLPELAAW